MSDAIPIKIKINLWEPQLPSSFGHISMEVEHGYMSFWPDKRQFQLYKRSRGAASYEADVEAEGRPADKILELPSEMINATQIIKWDIFSLMREPKLFQLLKEVLVETVKDLEPPPECIVGIDSRGFLFGPLLALELGVPFVPVRKQGKLPGEVVSASYSKEYGTDTLEVQIGSIQKGQKVLLVDDLLATGGTLRCAIDLVKIAGGEIAASIVLIELEELNGSQLITDPIVSLFKI